MEEMHHDHSQPTHSAKCDDCPYVARVHAHDLDDAAVALARDLAKHNLAEHDKETDAQSIVDAVRAKMESLTG